MQAVLDNLDNYTIDDIENLQGPHFPQWIRDALVRKKEGMSNTDIQARAEAIAYQMIAASQLKEKL